MNPILIQTLAYSAVMLLSIFLISIFFRGYFWNYVRVRLSFGRLLMVKIRSTMRDYFRVGYVEDGFLCYKEAGAVIRISLKSNSKVVYRCLGVSWIDVDDEKHSVCSTDYTAIDGFDSKKFSDLLTRALMRPSINSTQEKVLLIMIIVAVILAAAAAWLSYLSYDTVNSIVPQIPGIVKGAIADSTIIPAATAAGTL